MRVKAIRDCFVGSYHKAGEEFDYSGPKNTNLQPVAKASAEKSAAKSTSDKEAEAQQGAGGSPAEPDK